MVFRVGKGWRLRNSSEMLEKIVVALSGWYVGG
jgi:hypothetical protein